ncbi:MAG TPA: GNAT family N-acetyltransferase [Thermoanaerobaculia bacterium]
MSTQVRNNEAESRFETTVDGHLAVAEYFLGDGRITFTHTEVPEQLEGQGIGKALAKAALDHARAKNLKVVPQCRFIAGYIERNQEYQDLVAE